MLTAGNDRAKRWLRKAVPGFFLFVASFAALALALYPMYIIRPFREQKPADLQRALWVLLHDKAILVGLFLLITVLALLVWRRAGWITRLLLLTPAMGIAMHQAGIDPKDMVIAVTLGGESRAYPIREMGYHHVVNDRLHQLPIVVTY
jgi:hypothetical protein